MRHSAKRLLWILAACAACFIVVRAEVFMRVGIGTPAQVFSELGGASVRTGAVRINGQPGTMGVFGFDKPLRTLAGELARKLGRADISRDVGPLTPTLMFPWQTGSAAACTVFLFADPNVDNVLALVLQMDAGADAKDAAPEWPWRDVAMPGGLAMGFSATVSDGRTGLVTGTSPLSPDAMRTAMRERLAAAGWTSMTPAAEVTSVTLFARGSAGRNATPGDIEIFLVSVLPPAEADREAGVGSSVLLLRRKPDPAGER